TVRGHDEISALLTAPGAPLEMEEIEIRGAKIGAWLNAPPPLRAMLEATSAFADLDYQVLGDERMTYGEHYRRVAGLAHLLVDEYHVQPGDRVAIMMRNLPEWSIAFFAATSIGAIAVPLNAWWT